MCEELESKKESSWNKARNGIKLLMTPGPVEVSPRVLSALAQPVIYHYYPAFVEFFGETVEKISHIFEVSREETSVLILQGEGVLGLEASIACSINPGEKVIVLENGPFGKGMGEFVKNAGGVPIYYHEETNKVFDDDSVAAFLEENRDAVALTMVHCETPAGLLNPPERICRKAKSLNMLTVVDCVASLGGAEFKPEDWGIDIAVSASQKCLSAPSALTPMTVSKFAWERIERKKNPVRNSYLSLLDWKDAWISQKRFPFTPFTAEVNALSASLDEILEEGLENVLERHLQVARYCRSRLARLGLKTWPLKEEFCSPTVTAITLPKNVNDAALIRKIADRNGILIGGGYKELKGHVLRIGHMGFQAQRSFMSATMDALEDSIKN